MFNSIKNRIFDLLDNCFLSGFTDQEKTRRKFLRDFQNYAQQDQNKHTARCVGCRDHQSEYENHLSPCGRYSLKTTLWKNKEGHLATKGTLKHCVSGDIIAEIIRNASPFQHTWIGKHPSGNKYLICGEDFRGVTVINVENGERIDWVQPEPEFLWKAAYPSPDGRLLAVVGSHWSCNCDIMIIDFSFPMIPPWPILGIVPDYADPHWSDINTAKWLNNDETAPIFDSEGNQEYLQFRKAGGIVKISNHE